MNAAIEVWRGLSQKTVGDMAERLERVLKDKVRLAFLFGSQVKGYSLRGDIDVAVFFGKHVDPYKVGALLADLYEALGREDIDVLVIDSCDNVALAHEAVQGEPIIGDEAEILMFRTKIASRYMDFKEKLNKSKLCFLKVRPPLIHERYRCAPAISKQ